MFIWLINRHVRTAVGYMIISGYRLYVFLSRKKMCWSYFLFLRKKCLNLGLGIFYYITTIADIIKFVCICFAISLVESVLLIFLVFCFVLIWAYTFWVPCCDVRYDVPIKRCSVRVYLQLFVAVLVSYLCYLCLFAHSGVQHILCCVFVLFVFVLCTICCHFLWIVNFW